MGLSTMIRSLLLLLTLVAAFLLGTKTALLLDTTHPSDLRSTISRAIDNAILSEPPSAPEQSMHADMQIPDALWISEDLLRNLPTSGPAWERLVHGAGTPHTFPSIAEKDNKVGILTLAKALVHARTGKEEMRDAVISACMMARGSEIGGTTLLLGKHLLAYVLAANLVTLPRDKDVVFRIWLEKCLVQEFPDGKTLRSTHEVRPNNWGTFAGASRLATAMYLKNTAEVRRCAEVFKGWLGDRKIYDGFVFKDRSWQSSPMAPVGINPVGAVKDGHTIDGVLPDDQRRGGAFSWPPPKENYVYTALQGAVAQAILLDRCGYPVWEWEDQALLRAFKWLYQTADYPAVGDDLWMVPAINHAYGTNFTITPPFKTGKNLDWTDWVYHP